MSYAGIGAPIFRPGVKVAGMVIHPLAMPMEGYQREVYRKDGLRPGPHKLTILVTNSDRSFVVVDAFDVRQ